MKTNYWNTGTFKTTYFYSVAVKQLRLNWRGRR